MYSYAHLTSLDKFHPVGRHGLWPSLSNSVTANPEAAEYREAVDPEVVHGDDEDAYQDADQYNAGDARRADRANDVGSPRRVDETIGRQSYHEPCTAALHGRQQELPEISNNRR